MGELELVSAASMLIMHAYLGRTLFIYVRQKVPQLRQILQNDPEQEVKVDK